MRYQTRTFCVALALTLSASEAAAQFTAVVQPPKPKANPAAQTAATPGATTKDGATRLADMRAWVDSAAGIPAPAVTAGDSNAVVVDTASGAIADTTTMPAVNEAGMRAPDTATPVPAFAIAGLLMLGAGAWLLRRART